MGLLLPSLRLGSKNPASGAPQWFEAALSAAFLRSVAARRAPRGRDPASLEAFSASWRYASPTTALTLATRGR
jgi:hypothetical protein